MKKYYLLPTAFALALVISLIYERPALQKEEGRASTSDPSLVKPLPTASNLEFGVKAATLDRPILKEEIKITRSDPTSKDYYADLPQLEALIEGHRHKDTSSLSQELKEIDHKLSQESWIERANRGELDNQEYSQLAALLQQQSAVHMALIRKQLEEIEEDFL